MGRKRKTGAEYFSHDVDMRNNQKIKILRFDYKLEGYGVYLMLLETLAGSNDFIIKIIKQDTWKILAIDFSISINKLKKIIERLNELELIEITDDYISCPELTESMQPLLDKREAARKQAENQPRHESGQFKSFNDSENSKRDYEDKDYISPHDVPGF